ncbi:NAD(P)-binding protein [Lindgomyces ingoldianus]|uniref:NAD(P)-binding protein n=1 Tax=Lindgomyces ingoldianus TaxID=673940 RepID=A0ACB6QK64_9PLEO|nr:NAD(P)-binding protein [Lindgomyces ingoldianus]KAF2467295.1 NAD(P)-binding protein [Lindgomyces ingoldianus]
MTSFTISDSDLQGVKDKVVIVTGAASGIGLATVKRLLSIGARVVASDVNEMPEPEKSQVTFKKVDVTSWKEQLEMFKMAKEKFGTIDHVFANAGISPTVNLLEEDVDENGDLLPPKLNTINVNLLGCMYTTKLGIYYIKQNLEGGSIVMTGSGSSFRRFSPTDYTTSKHAVLGMLRALYGNLYPKIPIRINSIAPSWTDTAIVPRNVIPVIGEDGIQSADVVARSVIVLMADQDRHGEMIYSDRGKFWDIENGEVGLNRYASKMLGQEGVGPEEEVSRRLKKMTENMAGAAAATAKS